MATEHEMLPREVYDLSIDIFWHETKVEAWQMPGAADEFPDEEERRDFLLTEYEERAEKTGDGGHLPDMPCRMTGCNGGCARCKTDKKRLSADRPKKEITL